MIEKVIPYSEKFSKETLLIRLELVEVSLKQSGYLPKIEIVLNALSMRSKLSKSVSTSGNFTSSSKSKSKEEHKIEEGITLLMKREIGGDGKFDIRHANRPCMYQPACCSSRKSQKRIPFSVSARK